MPKGSFEWEYDHEQGLVLRIKPALRKMLTDEAKAHFTESRREMLVAIRNLIDVTLEHMETKAKAPPRARSKIKVE